MAVKEFKLRLADFGTLTSKWRGFVSPNDASVSTCVDTRDGTVRSIPPRVYADSPSFWQPTWTNNARGIQQDAYWPSSDDAADVHEYHNLLDDDSPPIFTATDADWEKTVIDGTTVGTVSGLVSYYTQNVGVTPTYGTRIGNGYFRFGFPVAPAAAISPGSSAGTVRYAVTWVDLDTGAESNPSPITGTLGQGAEGATITLPVYDPVAYNDPNRTNVWRRVYRTQANDPSGQLYFLAEVQNNTATTLATSGTPDTSRPLEWAEGGQIDNPVAPFDHSGLVQEPSVIASSIHAVNEGDGRRGGGLLFVAIDNTLRWSTNGVTQYWPIANQWKAPSLITAIVSWNAQTFVFTEDAVYLASGVADYAIRVTKTGAMHGVPQNCGRAVVQTPMGIMYPTFQGLAVFNGSISKVVSDGVIKASELLPRDGFAMAQGVYLDGYYFLLTTEPDWVALDAAVSAQDTYDALTPRLLIFDALDKFKVTQGPDAMVIWPAVGQAKVHGVAYRMKEGGYYILSTDRDGEAALDSLNERAAFYALPAISYESLEWAWTTPRLSFGEPWRHKRLLRMAVECDGDVTVSVYVEDSEAPVAVFPSIEPAKLEWLPKGVAGKDFTLKFEGQPGSRLIAVDLRGEIEDGT